MKISNKLFTSPHRFSYVRHSFMTAIANLTFKMLVFGMLVITPEAIFSQSFCHTTTSPSNKNFDMMPNNKSGGGPYHIRIYAHVIRQANHTGGQTPNDVLQAFSFLDMDFNPHDIFFEWDGCIDYIDDDIFYNTNDHTVLRGLFDINNHTDGIDIYMMHDEHAAVGGIANGIGVSSELIVSGMSSNPPVSAVKSHIISHEMGHVLFLYHTFENQFCPELPNGSNCESCGDLVCDTPAQPGGGGVDPLTCEWSLNGTSDPYDPDERNIMGGTYPGCMEYFSEMQGERMSDAITNLAYLQETLVEPPLELDACGCETEIHIVDATTYSSDLKINGNIFVHAPTTLTITSTISMGQGKFIVVERGAKLHLDGGTLTKCPEADNWEGIRVEGNSSADQPSAFGAPVAGLAGIVLMTNNAHVEWARTAMSTSKLNETWNAPFRGGMIHCENTTFSHNGRVAEILKYDRTNQCKFDNCTMDGAGIGYAGVTIWDTDGVTFNRCRFYRMTSQGVSTTDASAIIVDGNDFVGNNRGIVSRASFPAATSMKIGEASSEPNYFFNNTVHIEAEATDKYDKLEIINNEFFKSNAAIRLNGPSRYIIKDNSVDQTLVAVNSFSTGALQNNQHNYIQYNTFTGTFGLNVLGENRELQFLCNDFTTSLFDFRLRERSGAAGEIRYRQGNNDEAAGNCFTNPGQVLDIFTSGLTTSFDYYVKGGSATCQIPLNSGNYIIKPSTNAGCLDGGGFNENPTETDYNNIKNQIAAIMATGGQPAGQLADLLEEKEHILLHLIEGYIRAGNTASAIGLLDTENTVAAQLMKYGIQVNAGLYQNAQATLNALSNSVPEMPTFKQIQAINLGRLQQGGTYQLSESDSLLLENISISDMGIKSYARSVLYLLTGREFFDVFTMEDGGFSSSLVGGNNPQSISQISKESLAVFPNPTGGEFTVWVPESIAASNLRITTVFGQTVYKQELSGTVGPIVVADKGWREGMYIVQLLGSDNKVMETKKIFIRK